MPRITTIESIENPYRCLISNGTHTWYADEPESNQGGDTGPSPSEQLLAAVGSCAVITLRMYAARKNWPLDTIRISLRMEDVKTENGTITRIYESLEITGELNEEQRDRLRSLIPKCPVAKAITGTVELIY
jgi:putative redox protein